MNKVCLCLILTGLLALAGAVPKLFAADKTTITGEVIDTFCYTAAQAKGEGHRKCGLNCAAKGIPVALLEDGTNKVYVLLPNKSESPVPKAAVDKMGQKAQITGTVYSVGGSQFLTVDSVK
jgi:hypothetical protein